MRARRSVCRIRCGGRWSCTGSVLNETAVDQRRLHEKRCRTGGSGRRRCVCGGCACIISIGGVVGCARSGGMRTRRGDVDPCTGGDLSRRGTRVAGTRHVELRRSAASIRSTWMKV
jgi:hypothetical protein